MAILQISSTYPPYRGGMGNACFQWSKALIDLGYDVIVLTLGEKNGTRIGKYGEKIISVKPILKMGNAGFAIPVSLLRRLNIDLIILHSPSHFFGDIVSLLLSTTNTPLIIFQHMWSQGGKFSIFYRAYDYVIMPLLGIKAKKILTSRLSYFFSGPKWVKTNLVKGKIQSIPFYVMKPRNISKGTSKRHKEIFKGNFSERFNIVFIGGMDLPHYFKGVDILLRALALVYKKNPNSSTVLHLIGEGELKTKYEKIANRLNISEKCFFYGNVSEDLKNKILHHSDLLVLPSINSSEAFGLVLLEAMINHVPTIASDLPGVREVLPSSIIENRFPPRDYRALATLIQKYEAIFHASPKTYSNLRLLAFSHVSKQYSYKRFLRRICYLIKRVTKHSNAGLEH